MDALGAFRIVNKLEGFSYILLLFVAMPLKYGLDIAVATRIAGTLHGILFVAFCITLFLALVGKKVSFTESVIFFLLSLVPFGSFYTDKLIGRKQEAR